MEYNLGQRNPLPKQPLNERAIIVLPTYNEAENLPLLVEQILPLDVHVLVVDDNSPDGTGDVAEALQSINPAQVHVLHRPAKRGLGPAYIAGFKWAIGAGYDLIMQMDSDLSHDPRYLPDFFAKIQHADVVLGSRYIAGGGTVDWTFTRKLLSRFGNFYARTILGLPYRDVTGGFRCFRREVLQALCLDDALSNGYAFMIELASQSHNMGFHIVETPIVFPERRHGTSKMSAPIILEAVLLVWKLRLSQARR